VVFVRRFIHTDIAAAVSQRLCLVSFDIHEPDQNAAFSNPLHLLPCLAE
jgi:hypothetical protein